MQNSEYKKAFNKASYICSRSEKCKKDITLKLRQWDITPEVIEKVINDLVEQNYIDENRYAHSFVRDKFRFNSWGRTKITYMLKSKGIREPIIYDALGEISDEDYHNTLRKIIEKKIPSIKSTDEFEKRKKLMLHAIGKGYEPDEIMDVLMSRK